MNPFATIDELRARTTEAIIGQSGLNHAGLNAAVRRRFGSADWRDGGVMQAPVLEAALPYVLAEESLDDLAGCLLHPRLVQALDGADTPNRPYRFRRTQKPYAHQIQSWRLLSDKTAARSVLVTSGTGSGKTECFLVPILDDLARQAEASPHRLEGVRAIMLYPLNALIASQEERLRAWTAPFEGAIRFALYNGMLPDRVKAGEAAARPESVADRRSLRAAPPPIVVTNVTMLEYMLLRPDDAPILKASQGKLRYVVLDEAHTYVGAQAAEIALLLRRVCLAFGVDPADVRFIATSATIGGGETVEHDLHRFLADVSGAPDDHVHVVTGRTQIPELPELHAGGPIQDLDHFSHLGGHPAIRPLLSRLYAGATPWSAVSDVAEGLGLDAAELALKIANAQSAMDQQLAPLRVHSFHRAAPGLWSCLDPACSLARPADWPFGAVHYQPADICGCGAPLFEIVSCSNCGEAFLDVEETATQKLARPASGNAPDEFAQDADADVVEADDEQDGVAAQTVALQRLVAQKPLGKGYRWLCVEPATGRVHDRDGAPGVVKLAAYDRVQPETCPACAVTAREKQDLIRAVRFGAPFILGNATPILLEGAAHPDEASDPKTWANGAPPPMGGRQLLSFTDSRQGTARLSAKLQTASERNYVRSVVYHTVQDVLSRATDPKEAERLSTNIAALRPVFEAGRDPAIGTILSGYEAELAKLGRKGEAGLPWDEMVQRLAERPEVGVWIKSVWSRRALCFDKETPLAEFLLLREFVRRPPRANSPETLGLARLRFADIDKIPDAVTPSAFQDLGGSGQEWRDYLHLLATFLVRGRSAVRVGRDILQWVPPPGVGSKEFVYRLDRPSASYEVNWPTFGPGPVGRTAMIVNLLEQVMGRSLDDSPTREAFNDVFAAAWSALDPLLRPAGAANNQLSFSKANVAPVTTAGLCPVTRRLLDVTFRGLSPYGAKTRGAPPAPAIPFEMPRHPLPFLGAGENLPPHEARQLIGEWLATDPAVQALRSQGAWGDIGDRLALSSDYFRSAEHSAQQPPLKLRRYETDFKVGAINVLNCSTTMEMGVDIGSVSHVMMTNLPPSIANYRQRVGRAGRRGQPLSMAFTFCKDRPLDREAFRNPVAYLSRTLRPPKVALQSTVIIQRHVNALLFASYVREHGGDALKMHAGPFFGCNAAIGAAEEIDNAAARMAAWARRPETMAGFASAIASLTRGSILDGDAGVFEVAAARIENAREGFAAEWRVTQELAAGCGSDKAARTRLEIQLRRTCQDYLLSTLADRGVLPGHGFPTDVVSFITRPEISRGGEGTEERSRYNAYPQRSLDTAIREYAPGSEIVLDGLVHQSAGVTLNWKRPASTEGQRDVQALRWRWRCLRCGESGSAGHFDSSQTDCPGCGTPAARWSEYLQPAGFAVDLRVDPHADADVVSDVAPEPTAVSAGGGNWTPLFDPARGRRRATREGSVFFSNAGASRAGYAICLSCGRADAPPGVAHNKLLGAGECDGSFQPFSRKEGLLLGHEIHTDVFEFQPAGWLEPGGAMAFGVALREALARSLGIEPDEMGVAAERRLDGLGGRTMSVFLHDKATGGAGFAVQADELFSDLLPEVERILDCKVRGCVHGCPACVLVGDLSDDAVKSLDRQAALAFVRERLLTDASPEPADRASPDARFSLGVQTEMTQALERGGTRATLHLRGNLDPTLLESWSAANFAETWSRRGKQIVVALDEGCIDKLDGAQRLHLRDLTNRWNVSVEEGLAAQFPNGAGLLAEVSGPDQTTVFATRGSAAAIAGEAWGSPAEVPIVRFKQPAPAWAGQPVDLDRLRPAIGAIVRHVTTDLDGKFSQFGRRCGSLLQSLVEQVGLAKDDQLVRMEYQDRYLRSPLTVRLCLETLGVLAGPSAAPTPLVVRTSPLETTDKYPRWLDNDWKREDDRAVVASLLAKGAGLNLDWRTTDGDHARRLTLEFASGRRAQILFDQGFGAWRCNRGTNFEFNGQPNAQLANLRRLETGVQINRGASTFFVAESAQP